MTTRSENGTAYTQEFNAENKVERVVALEDADFSDQFDTKDTNAWAYNSYQTVPFNLSGHGNVVKNVGTGNDYAANFRRKGYNLTGGESVRVEFRVTESNSNATFAVETSGSWDVDYNRWGLRARNDKITIHYRTGGVTTQSVTLIDDLETDTWYVATLVVDDGNGFYLRIHKKDDPSIQGSYHFDGMPAGKSWRFRHWIKYGTSYVDNYSEQSASQTTFVYDGDGNRVKRQEGSVTTYYPSAGSGQAVGGTYEKQGSTVTKYYYFGGKRVAMRKGSTLTYLHGGHLGSTSLATHGTSGAKLSRVLYYPYGETRYTEGTLPTDYRFTGQRQEGFGLYDYVARYYDPYLGRFVSADSIVPDPDNPQDWNRYAYTRNNPVRYTDPSGHCIPGAPGALGCPGDTSSVEQPGDPSGLRGDAYAAWLVDVILWAQQENAETGGMLYFAELEQSAAGDLYPLLMKDPELLQYVLYEQAMLAAPQIVATTGDISMDLLQSASDWALGKVRQATTMLPAGERLEYCETPWDAAARQAAGANDSLPTLVIDSEKMPGIAAGIQRAQAAGAPTVLTRTTDPGQKAQNRYAATQGFSGTGSPDEYPFASTTQGGKDAFVTGVPLREQHIQGGVLSSFYQTEGIGDGYRFRVVVK